MKIRMVEARTGPRWDGRPWPGYGGEIDVDDEEGAAVCAAGWAVPVPVEKRAETPEGSLQASEETRAAAPEAAAAPAAPAGAGTGSPGVNDPKSAWVAYAVTRGTASADAETLTKQQLIDAYGSTG